MFESRTIRKTRNSLSQAVHEIRTNYQATWNLITHLNLLLVNYAFNFTKKPKNGFCANFFLIAFQQLYDFSSALVIKCG